MHLVSNDIIALLTVEQTFCLLFSCVLWFERNAIIILLEWKNKKQEMRSDIYDEIVN